mmetsp:Transcript_66287/g.138163  ORF Transcript_66287/g.138163 Transcript_66287/m.138163 type:complete len:1268 (-) Transcript_66287:281-4084(-)|eukprot:CAMPEP_0181308358 /NCGR_PEP_ID=MMETSP1101-20121128/11418_1 /TAXON_ID=46948 /ORGANISM="Rhodomonas abbreviata, Strain Caron Lab Isolate" /LENGTH=1267 /DNA_ID=CAMNT_0023414731 /DNA_START=144 /DNA_END=3947 /DNA_ORIENTATION=+
MPSAKRARPARGCLYKLVVCNFKSYAGELTIGPFKDFTCVIGPNGSGKSNLMDAVSFVVGVNTAQLRGARLADFRTNLATASDSPTSVTLFYQQPAEGGAMQEMQFTRTITVRDSSEYRVDGKKVDEKEYQKMLKSVGLLVKSRNFLVFQNEVESVAQKSPKQLTELIERISGSEECKKDYEELQESKGAAAQSAVAVYKRSLLVSNEKKQCKEQVKEATTYEKLQAEALDLKSKRYLFDLFQIEKKLASCAQETEKHAAKLEDCNANCKAVGKAADKKAKAKAEKQKSWASFDQRVEQCEKTIKSIQHKDILKFETEISSRKKDLASLAESVSANQEKLKETDKKVASDKKVLETLDAELKNETDKAKSNEIQLGGQQLSRYNTLKQSARAKTHKAKEALEKTERANDENLREIQKMEGDLERLRQRKETLESKVKDDGSLKEKHNKDFQSFTEDRHKLVSEISDLDKRLKEEMQTRKALTDKDEAFQSQLGDARAGVQHNHREAQTRERLEYLCQSFPGVRGRVIDLCKVRQRQYELAVTVVMESNMDAVVVDKEETAKRCIEHLRDKKAPPMTFLPLDSINAKPPDERLRMIPGAKLAVDIIDFDPAVEKAMWYATGNTVVVPTLEDAKRLAYSSQHSGLRCKVVSAADACLISKSGAMTGGDTSQLTSKAQRWQANEIDKLTEKWQANSKDLQMVRANIETMQRDLSLLERKKHDVDHKLQTAKRQKDGFETDFKTRNKEIEVLKKQIEESGPKITQVRQAIDARNAQLQRDRAAFATINEEIFKEFCAELNISSIEEYEGGTLKQQRERQERLNELTAQVAKMASKIEKALNGYNSLKQKNEDKLKEAEKLEKEVEELQSKDAASRQKLREAMEAKSEEVRQRNQVKEEIDEIEKELKEIQTVLKTTQEERDTVLKLVERAEANIDKYSAQRASVLEQCEMEEVKLPKKREAGESQATGDGEGGEGDGEGAEQQEAAEEGEEFPDSMDVDDGAVHSQIAKEARDQIAQARLDYTKLPREHRKEMGDKEQDRVRNELDEQQKKIQDTMEGMNPNMKAFEQLKEVEGRFNEVQTEMLEAKQRSQDLAKQFEEVKQKRCELFNDCFDHVKNCIDKVYKELTSDPTKVEQSVGGSAYLTLNNQEEPYLDGIKYDTIPPGKRFMDMTHLSGGEKTVAALALLFSINSFYPAPFIVLDEVDAALDARNVAKVTRYISQRSAEQQCVIISLKERFYEKADGLVGICRDISGGQSKAFTLDLTKYEEAAA